MTNCDRCPVTGSEWRLLLHTEDAFCLLFIPTAFFDNDITSAGDGEREAINCQHTLNSIHARIFGVNEVLRYFKLENLKCES